MQLPIHYCIVPFEMSEGVRDVRTRLQVQHGTHGDPCLIGVAAGGWMPFLMVLDARSHMAPDAPV